MAEEIAGDMQTGLVSATLRDEPRQGAVHDGLTRNEKPLHGTMRGEKVHDEATCELKTHTWVAHNALAHMRVVHEPQSGNTRSCVARSGVALAEAPVLAADAPAKRRRVQSPEPGTRTVYPAVRHG